MTDFEGVDAGVTKSFFVFRNLITGSNSNGKQYICEGEFEVCIDQIPADAPQDWSLGPKQKPGAWGAYRAHGYFQEGHGKYAFAIGATPEAAFDQACGHFAGHHCEWPRKCATVVEERQEAA